MNVKVLSEEVEVRQWGQYSRELTLQINEQGSALRCGQYNAEQSWHQSALRCSEVQSGRAVQVEDQDARLKSKAQDDDGRIKWSCDGGS